MSMNLLDSLSGVFDNEVVRRSSATLGENETGVSKAISGGIPSLLYGIINSSTADGGSSLLNLSRQTANSGIFNNSNIGGLFGASESGNFLNTGSDILSGLFGTKAVALTNSLSNYAGIRPSGAKSILSAIATVALSLIGKHAVTNNLSASGLMNWLTGQRSQVANAIPSGLNLTEIFDRPREQGATTEYTESKSGNKWVLPMLLLLGVALALWMFSRSCNRTSEDLATSTDTVATTPAPMPAPEMEPARESLKVKLPDGKELNAFRGGIEDRLVSFLNDPNSKPGKDVWFDFDNLNFESESARITPESQEQVNNIAAILNAYPKLKIKIGGYTDVTGDSTANLKLSQERADAVVTAIKAAGSKESQLLGGEGYGSIHAKAAADAPDQEKRKDRRISVSVREK